MLESELKQYSIKNEVVSKEKSAGLLKTIIRGIENAIVNHYRHKYDKIKASGKWEEYKAKTANNYARWLPKLINLTNKIEVYENKESIPLIGDNGFILISNHKYTLDPFYITCVLRVDNTYRVARWVSKYENSKGIIGAIAEPIDTIFLSKDRKWTSLAKQKTFETLNKKEGVCICPEGTRVKGEKLSKFKRGAAELCLEYDVPYVPTAIIGKPIPFKGRVELHVSKPVFLDKIVIEEYEQAGEKEKLGMQRVLADDMHEQVLALLEKRTVPKSRYASA